MTSMYRTVLEADGRAAASLRHRDRRARARFCFMCLVPPRSPGRHRRRADRRGGAESSFLVRHAVEIGGGRTYLRSHLWIPALLLAGLTAIAGAFTYPRAADPRRRARGSSGASAIGSATRCSTSPATSMTRRRRETWFSTARPTSTRSGSSSLSKVVEIQLVCPMSVCRMFVCQRASGAGSISNSSMKHQPQSSPGSKLRMIGWLVVRK